MLLFIIYILLIKIKIIFKMQAILIMAALMVFSITTVSGKCDPFLIQINIYDDEGCKTINTLATQGAKISEEDA